MVHILAILLKNVERENFDKPLDKHRIHWCFTPSKNFIKLGACRPKVSMHLVSRNHFHAAKVCVCVCVCVHPQGHK